MPAVVSGARGSRTRVVERRASRRRAPAPRRCPRPPGRPCAPCRSGWAATARRAGGAGARARTWPRRADPCAAGCRSSVASAVLKVEDLHRCARRSRKPPLPPGLVTPRMATGEARGQISTLPCTSSPAPGPPAPPGRCCPCSCGPALGDALGEHSLAVAAHRRRARVGDLGGGARRRAPAAHGEPHRPAVAAPAALAAANWAALAGDRRRRRRRWPWPAPPSPWSPPSRRSPARCSSTARPTATSAACPLRVPGAAAARAAPAGLGRPRWRRRSPARCCWPPSSGSLGRLVLAVGAAARRRRRARAPRAGPPLGGARAGRARAPRPARAGGAGAVPAGVDRRLGPGAGRRRRRRARPHPAGPRAGARAATWPSPCWSRPRRAGQGACRSSRSSGSCSPPPARAPSCRARRTRRIPVG